MNWILCVLMVLVCGCQQKPQENQYKEIVVESVPSNAPTVPVQSTDLAATADPHAGLDMPAMGLPVDRGMNNMFTWKVPQGWKQETGTGMRLATFQLDSNSKAIDCSIVALGGVAGGLEANLHRWMGQIGVKASAEQLNALISSAPSTKIKTGQEGKVFDFISIQSRSKASDKSMVVVMVTMNEATLFVKMSGTVETIQKNKDNFFKLAGSVEYHSPTTGVPNPGAEMNPTADDPHAGLDMSAMGGIIEAPTSQNILAWVSPEGWTEEAGKHMRMVTFHPVSYPNSMDCYIIALSGPAGGLEANLERWLGQLGFQASSDYVTQLISSAQTLSTKDGLEAKVYDFTSLQLQASPTDKSMMAAMIALEKTTVFVKMTGTVDTVKQNKDNFLKLIGSITRK